MTLINPILSEWKWVGLELTIPIMYQREREREWERRESTWQLWFSNTGLEFLSGLQSTFPFGKIPTPTLVTLFRQLVDTLMWPGHLLIPALTTLRVTDITLWCLVITITCWNILVSSMSVFVHMFSYSFHKIGNTKIFRNPHH